MADYAIFRVDKIKDKGSMKRLAAHHERTGSPVANARFPYVSKQLIGRESMVDGVEASLPEKYRSDAVLAMDFVLTASPGAFIGKDGKWDQKKVESFEKVASKWLKQEFGECVHARLHLDEQTPHAQGFIVPNKGWKPGETLSAKTLFNPKTLQQYQTSWHKAMTEAGFKVERGMEGSTAKHEDINAYYGRVNAKAEPLPKLSPVPKPTAAQLAAEKIGIPTEHSKAKAVREAELPAYRKAVFDQRKDYVAKAREAETRAKAAEQRALAAERQLAYLKENTAQLRKTPLEDVLERLGATRHPKEVNRWDTQAGAIWIEDGGQRFNSFKNDELKGVNAIDLVMKVQGVDFKQAVKWLADEFGEMKAASEIVARAALVARQEVAEATKTAKPISPLPEPEPSTWPRVKRYLEDVRRIPAVLVESMRNTGKAFADKFSNVCFKTDAADGVEVRGTRAGEPWRGHRGQKSGFTMPGDPDKVVIVESAIEAVSVNALHGYTAVSTGGMNPKRAAEIAKEYKEKGATIYAGQNNDDAGNKQAAKLMKDVRGVERLASPPGKDWNDQLRTLPADRRLQLEEAIKHRPAIRAMLSQSPKLG